MFFSKSARLIFLLCLYLTACKGMENDLLPSQKDQRPQKDPSQASQQTSITLYNTAGQPITIAPADSKKPGTLLYFTMWCPVCASDTDQLISQVIPQFPQFDYFVIDYVSGDYKAAKASQDSAGYPNPPFSVLADPNQLTTSRYHATMGIMVVLGPAGEIRFNEGFKNGVKLKNLLGSL